MSSSNLYKRPVWLKGKSAAGPKPEPTQSPHSTDLDMFSRASQYTPQQDRDQSSAKRRRISDDRTPSLTPYDNRSEARGSKSRSPRGPSAARAAEAAKSARRESSNGASAARAAKAARKEALAADIEHGDAVGQGSPPSIRKSRSPSTSPEPIKVEYPPFQKPTAKAQAQGTEPVSPVKVYQSVERDGVVLVEPTVIDLEDDPGDLQMPNADDTMGGEKDRNARPETPQAQEQNTGAGIDEVESEVSDDAGDEVDFDKLVRRAQRRKDKEARNQAKSTKSPPTNTIATTSPRKDPSAPRNSESETAWVPHIPPAPLPSDQEPDPVVKIFIHSHIPDTKPLLFVVRLSDPLRKVRMAWCAKQDFDEDSTESVFLMWGQLKVFGMTTCKSLGIKVNESGELSWKPSGKTGVAIAEDLEMQAWTPQLLEEHNREEQKANSRLVSALDSEEPVDMISTNADSKQFRITLKSRGYRDYKLLVRPRTPFEQVMRVFCKKHDMPPDKELYLVFDGDRLDESGCMRDTDIEDGDEVEVHIK